MWRTYSNKTKRCCYWYMKYHGFYIESSTKKNAKLFHSQTQQHRSIDLLTSVVTSALSVATCDVREEAGNGALPGVVYWMSYWQLLSAKWRSVEMTGRLMAWSALLCQNWKAFDLRGTGRDKRGIARRDVSGADNGTRSAQASLVSFDESNAECVPNATQSCIHNA